MDKMNLICDKAEKRIKTFASAAYRKFESLTETASRSNRANLILILVIAVSSFLLMYLMNTNTPYVAEDYDYHYIFADDGRKIAQYSYFGAVTI